MKVNLSSFDGQSLGSRPGGGTSEFWLPTLVKYIFKFKPYHTNLNSLPERLTKMGFRDSHMPPTSLEPTKGKY